VNEARSLIERLIKADAHDRRRTIAGMTQAGLAKCEGLFALWAHPSQLPPPSGDWRIWLLLAGRGFGKTRAGAEWVFGQAVARPQARIALVGANIADARSIMVEGVSGLLDVARSYDARLHWEPSLGRLKWPNGSQAHLFSGDHANGLRGPEHDVCWADELAKWREAEGAWMNLQFGLRRGANPRALITTTPRPMALLRTIRDQDATVTTHGRTRDNINLDEAVIALLTATYGGTRIGAQELDGVMLEDVEGALWTHEMIERARLEAPATFDRIVVGVDPPAGAGEGSDACGIVVCGARGEALYVIEDATVRGLSPEGWANRVAAAALRWNTHLVVAEANNGGAMVESVLKAADLGLWVRLVHASRGKCARAEPIALKFESGKAFFAGEFPELEAELGGMVAGGSYEGPSRSPDRADAMVWAMTVLSETRSGVPRVRRL